MCYIRDLLFAGMAVIVSFYVVCWYGNMYLTSTISNNIFESTNIYILAFNACNLPTDISIEWTKCEVMKYIPRPRRCFNCQGFGHGSKTCRNPLGVCVRCSLVNHGPNCENPTKCINCSEAHPSSF